MKGEIEYYMSLERDYEYDEADAFNDLADIIEREYQQKERKLWSEIKQIYIDVGFLEPYEDGFIEKNGIRIQTIYGKRYPITHNGSKYEFNKSWSMWINK